MNGFLLFFSTYSAVSELIRFKIFALTTYYIGRLRKNGTLENLVSHEGCARFTWIFVSYKGKKKSCTSGTSLIVCEGQKLD